MDNFIEVIDITKTYWSEDSNTETKVVLPLSLSIKEGEIVFLGPSGCGKTTLMRIIGGLKNKIRQHHTAGDPLAGPDRRRGMVFQSTFFPWLSVRDNIKFGTRYRKDISATEKEEITDHYMDMVGLSTYGNFYTNRYLVGCGSGSDCPTLASSPDILLMDEPFGALDAQTREHLQFQLMEINKSEKKTTIFVTHDVEEAILGGPSCDLLLDPRVVQEIDVNAVIPVEDRRDRTADMQKFFSGTRFEIIRAEYQNDGGDLKWELILQEKVLITGANRGIGFGLAEGFLKAGRW